MTLAIALRAQDGLVLASDSRVTGGQPGSADTSQKFLQVNRDVGVMCYGLAVPGYNGITRLVNEVNPPYQRNIAYFSEIAARAEEIFKDEYRKWISNQRSGGTEVDENTSLVGFILAGYDSNETNQFRIVHWRSPNFQEEYRDDILAAQWFISRYLIDMFYFREISVECLKELVVFILTETSAVEPSVGGPIQMATITLSEGFQKVYDNDIRELLKKNQERHTYFRKTLQTIFE